MDEILLRRHSSYLSTKGDKIVTKKRYRPFPPSAFCIVFKNVHIFRFVPSNSLKNTSVSEEAVHKTSVDPKTGLKKREKPVYKSKAGSIVPETDYIDPKKCHPVISE